LTQNARDTGRPAAGGQVEDAPVEDAQVEETRAGGEAPHEPERPWLGRRRLMAAYAAFCAYAAAAAAVSGGRDRVWSIWAACGYAAALAVLWLWRGPRARITAVGVSVALAVLAPLLWLSVTYPLEDGMMVIDRAASLLLHHGSPYLPASQVTSWLSYNPYLPVMTLFGLPSAAGLGGLAGNSGVWIAIGTVIPLAAAFWIAMVRPGGRTCRHDALLATGVAVASPVVGLNLAVITTDPPVLALILLALALAARPELARPELARPGFLRAAAAVPARATGALGAGIALGAACDLKSTAWLAVPVLAAMFAVRDGARAAVRFATSAAVTAVVLVAALAPAALISWRAANDLIQNSVLFPLGLTRDKTPAESLLPGHMLTTMGTAGHVISVGLLLAAVLGVLISLVIRPPRDVTAAAWRLAIGLALMFLLGPQVRFGYFLYPLGLAGYVALTQEKQADPVPA
jgi:hypothetical protein